MSEKPGNGLDPALRQHSHCSFCGAAYERLLWPRVCARCGNITWRNPLPVAVLAVPVLQDGRVGVVTIRRDIEPKRGLLALPGGFMEVDESWQQSCVRELLEESGVQVDAAHVMLHAVHSSPSGNLVVFGRAPLLRAADLPPFAGNSEASGREILFVPTELAFPLHTLVLTQMLELYANQHAAHNESDPAYLVSGAE